MDLEQDDSLGRSGRGGGGFTLIELLVVVAIIALLVAILVPALQRAKEQAELTVCLSNLKQIATAIHVYATSNIGKLPGYMEPSSGGRPSPSWVSNESDWPRPDTGASPLNADYYAYIHDLYFIGGNSVGDNNPTTSNPNPRKLNPYVKRAEEIFRCPSDRGAVNISPKREVDRISTYDLPGWSGSPTRGSSYLYNACPGWFGPARVLSGKRAYELSDASRQVIMGDATMLRAWHSDEGPAPLMQADYNLVYTWHDLPKYHPDAPQADGYVPPGTFIGDYDSRGNVAFLDGHAATVLFKKTFITDEYIMYDMNKYRP